MNSYFICIEPSIIEKIFNGIRKDHNGTYPTTIAGLKITQVVDLTTDYDSSNPPTFKPRLPLSSGQMIQFRAGNIAEGVTIVLTVRCVHFSHQMKHLQSIVAQNKWY